MPGSNNKRVLPLIPHPDHLRKEAKARLADLKARRPALRLADVQLLLAQEYGYTNWGLLMAEVMCRTLPDRGRRARFAFQRDGRGDPDSAHEAHVEFFRVGVACQIGFYLAALVGVSLVFINQNGLKGLALLIQHSVGSAP